MIRLVEKKVRMSEDEAYLPEGFMLSSLTLELGRYWLGKRSNRQRRDLGSRHQIGRAHV